MNATQEQANKPYMPEAFIEKMRDRRAASRAARQPESNPDASLSARQQAYPATALPLPEALLLPVPSQETALDPVLLPVQQKQTPVP